MTVIRLSLHQTMLQSLSAVWATGQLTNNSFLQVQSLSLWSGDWEETERFFMDASVNQPIQVNNRFRWAAIIMGGDVFRISLDYLFPGDGGGFQPGGGFGRRAAGRLSGDGFHPTDPRPRELTLSHYQGQPVILNFWVSWCGPCIVEMPLLERAAILYRCRVTILGVNNGESLQTVQNFAAQRTLSSPPSAG